VLRCGARIGCLTLRQHTHADDVRVASTTRPGSRRRHARRSAASRGTGSTTCPPPGAPATRVPPVARRYARTTLMLRASTLPEGHMRAS
jgi:hypothetical protein